MAESYSQLSLLHFKMKCVATKQDYLSAYACKTRNDEHALDR